MTSKSWLIVTAVITWITLGSSISRSEQTQPDPRFGQWISPFDGKNFDGWYASRPESAAWNWKAEADGSMTNQATPDKKNHNIATERKFHNFETRIEFKTSGEHEGNSGLYMRGRAEMQIRNRVDPDKIAYNDAGALYRYKAPLVYAARPPGEWNQVHLTFIGTRFDVYLNDQRVQNNTYITGPTGAGRKDAFDSPGIFELQGDHDKVWFRNIEVRPLFESDGWREIFNRNDLTGWKALGGGDPQWVVEDGAVTNAGGHLADIVTEETFGDFLIYYQYKSEGNSGLYLRNLWEIQIETSHGKEPSAGTDGAIYSYYPPKVNMSRPEGEWSTIEAKVIGRKITVFHNGVLIQDGVECDARTYDRNNREGLDERGPILLQGDHGRVWFTNLWILPLD